jgi:hypothetical protein
MADNPVVNALGVVTLLWLVVFLDEATDSFAEHVSSLSFARCGNFKPDHFYCFNGLLFFVVTKCDQENSCAKTTEPNCFNLSRHRCDTMYNEPRFHIILLRDKNCQLEFAANHLAV